MYGIARYETAYIGQAQAHSGPMKPVELSYAWGGSAALPARGAALLRNPMVDVLQAVRDQGSISAAARAIGLSYRHVWGQLRAWEQEVGHELIVWERGQAARLSPFGQRLLNAERLAQARLAPQVEHLRAELQQAFARAIEVAAQSSSETIAPPARTLRCHDCIWTSAFVAAWTRSARSTKAAAPWRAFMCSRFARPAACRPAPTSPCSNRACTKSSDLPAAPRA